jgi:molecular chaperone IbpA
MTNNRTITADQFLRHFIGYDRVTANASAFPPHNIEKLSEDAYRLTLAVAGFSRDEIEMYEHQGTLTISGRKKAPTVSHKFKSMTANLRMSEKELAENERLWAEENPSRAYVDPRGNAATLQNFDVPLGGSTYLHQGIAFRDWDRQFNLGEFIVVSGASMENGLLLIDLERIVPESHKPKLIEIRG